MPVFGTHKIIDCDIHNELPSLKTLYPYLPEHWVAYCNESAFVGPDANDYPKGAPLTARSDSKPASGNPPGSDLALLRAQTLDAWNAEVGILNCFRYPSTCSWFRGILNYVGSQRCLTGGG